MQFGVLLSKGQVIISMLMLAFAFAFALMMLLLSADEHVDDVTDVMTNTTSSTLQTSNTRDGNLVLASLFGAALASFISSLLPYAWTLVIVPFQLVGKCLGQSIKLRTMWGIVVGKIDNECVWKSHHTPGSGTAILVGKTFIGVRRSVQMEHTTRDEITLIGLNSFFDKLEGEEPDVTNISHNVYMLTDYQPSHTTM